MEPWGTPHVISVHSDEKFPIKTNKFLLFKQDSDQPSTVPESWTELCKKF